MIVFLPENSFGQEPLTRKISFLDGLPSDVVYDLFVDSNGLLYLGTDKGLVTYNGVHFNRIESLENLGNSIGSIQEDKSAVIWCKNLANQLFYFKNNQLIVDKVVRNLLLKTNSNLIDFCLTNNGMYILTQEAIYLYKEGKIGLVYKIDTSNLDRLTSLVYDKDSNKLYVSSTQLNLVFQNSILIKKQSQYQGIQRLELYKNQLTFGVKALNTDFVVGESAIIVKNPDLKNTFFNRLSTTKDNLWLCTNNGIYEFDEKLKNFQNGFLKGVRVTDIVQDLEGNHWISSLDEGLYMLPSRKFYELNVDDAADKRKTSYTRIAQIKNGNYFVGTNDGRILEITDAGIKKNVYDSKWDNTVEFINFIGDTIFTNYGLFRLGNPKLMTAMDYYGKALEPDNRGNLLLASNFIGGIIARDFVKMPNFGNPKRRYKITEYGVDRVKT
jgi:ligand-binding sensor domain-containing protein